MLYMVLDTDKQLCYVQHLPYIKITLNKTGVIPVEFHRQSFLIELCRTVYSVFNYTYE
jgi:hypothetical protein